MREYGSRGLLPNVDSLYGWSPMTGVGLLIGLLGEDSPTRTNACFVTRNRKTFSTSGLGAFLLGSSGFLLERVGLSSLTPQPNDSSWEDWWEKAEAATTGVRVCVCGFMYDSSFFF